MNKQERLTCITIALREAYELADEGSEAHGYIAEAFAYAIDDLSSFDDDDDEIDTYHAWDCAPAELVAEIERQRTETRRLLAVLRAAGVPS